MMFRMVAGLTVERSFRAMTAEPTGSAVEMYVSMTEYKTLFLL